MNQSGDLNSSECTTPVYEVVSFINDILESKNGCSLGSPEKVKAFSIGLIVFEIIELKNKPSQQLEIDSKESTPFSKLNRIESLLRTIPGEGHFLRFGSTDRHAAYFKIGKKGEF